MRYKLQLLDHDPIARPVELGVTLRDAQPDTTPAADSCCPSCDGWGVTVNDVPSSGDVNHFTDVAVTFTVQLLGGELCGGCLEWELRQLSFDSDPGQLADFVVTPNGCNAVTVVGAGSLSYAGLWLGLYPSLNGHPFCQPILFRMFEDCNTIIGPGATNTYFAIDSTLEGDPLGPLYGTDGLVDCPLAANRLAPDFALFGSAPCPDSVVTWAIVQNSGTSGQGETVEEITPLPNGRWRLTFSSPSDLTGSSYTVTPTVDSVEYADQAITFSQDVSQGP